MGCGGSGPLIHLSPQTGDVLEKGPVLQLHNLKRESGGGYRCVASAPSVPGLSRTQLVNVAIFGEALWTGIRAPLEATPGWVASSSLRTESHPLPCSALVGPGRQASSLLPHPSPCLPKDPHG